MGFSLLGLIVALAVLAPNLLLLAFPPRSAMPHAAVPVALTWVERAGQALCLVVPIITEPGAVSWWWLVPVILPLTAYYALWARYLLDGRRGSDLYRAVWKVPVPMALLPVLTFFAAAAWLGNPWLAAAATILAVGHIPASLLIARGLEEAH